MQMYKRPLERRKHSAVGGATVQNSPVLSCWETGRSEGLTTKGNISESELTKFLNKII